MSSSCRVPVAICLTCLIPILTATSAFAQDDVIPIGFVGDFSDVSKAYTDNMFLAFQLAVDDLNANGGALGRTVRVIRRDGGNDPQKHEDHVRELVEHEQVVAIFGGASSPCVLKASALCRQRQIPYLVSIGNSQCIVVEHGHPYVFLFEPNSWMETRGFSIFLTLMPWQRYAWIGPDYSWGREVLQNFKHHFAEIGAPIEWTTENWHPLGTGNYDAILQQVKRGNPEALVIASWGEDVRQLLLQADQQNLFADLAVFAWFTYDIKEDVGLRLPDGMWLLSRGPFNYLAQKYPEARKFVDTFVTRFRTYPNGFTICCYDSFLAWQQAVRKARSADPAAIAQALRGLEFVGLRGKSRIRSIDGQMDCPAYFGRLGDVPEYPFPVWQSVIEVPAAKTWLSEQEVLSRRQNAPP